MKTIKQPESLSGVLTSGSQVSLVTLLHSGLSERVAFLQGISSSTIGTAFNLNKQEFSPEYFSAQFATPEDTFRKLSSKQYSTSTLRDGLGLGVEASNFYFPIDARLFTELNPDVKSLTDISDTYKKLRAALKYLNVIQRKALELELPILISVKPYKGLWSINQGLLVAGLVLAVRFQVLKPNLIPEILEFAKEKFDPYLVIDGILNELAIAPNNSRQTTTVIPVIGKSPEAVRLKVEEESKVNRGRLTHKEYNFPSNRYEKFLEVRSEISSLGANLSEGGKASLDIALSPEEFNPLAVLLGYSMEYNRILLNIKRLSLHEPREATFVNV